MIIIFGAAVWPGGVPSPTLLHRTEAAFACGGVEAFYLPTGAAGRFPPSEASVMAGLLRQWGVPAGRIALDEQSRNTLASAWACARLLKTWPFPGGRPSVRIATSVYHMPRCRVLLRLCGVAAAACPAPPAPPRRWRWWLRESAALPVDTILLLIRKRLQLEP